MRVRDREVALEVPGRPPPNGVVLQLRSHGRDGRDGVDARVARKRAVDVAALRALRRCERELHLVARGGRGAGDDRGGEPPCCGEGRALVLEEPLVAEARDSEVRDVVRGRVLDEDARRGLKTSL